MRSLLSPSTVNTLRSLATLTALVSPSLAFTGQLGKFESAATRSLGAHVSRRDAMPLRTPVMPSQVRMMSSGTKVPIQITGNNIEVTPAIKEYVTDKIGSALSKVGRRVTKCDVHIIYDKNPSVANPAHAEVTLFAKGATIRASKTTHDMYASIDEVADLVKSKLVKYKERIIDSHRQGNLEPALDDQEIADFEAFNAKVTKEQNLPSGLPSVDMSVVRKKKFPMQPISVEEAVLCLEYIEHDFYVFKNKDTGKISVVYKRNHGGVGLIEPE